MRHFRKNILFIDDPKTNRTFFLTITRWKIVFRSSPCLRPPFCIPILKVPTQNPNKSQPKKEFLRLFISPNCLLSTLKPILHKAACRKITFTSKSHSLQPQFTKSLQTLIIHFLTYGPIHSVHQQKRRHWKKLFFKKYIESRPSRSVL